MTQTSVGTGNGYYYLQLNWTDDAGPEQGSPGMLFDNAAPLSAYCITWAGGTTPCAATFSANAGTPVSYSVTGDGNGGPYEVFLVVERLI